MMKNTPHLRTKVSWLQVKFEDSALHYYRFYKTTVNMFDTNPEMIIFTERNLQPNFSEMRECYGTSHFRAVLQE